MEILSKDRFLCSGRKFRGENRKNERDERQRQLDFVSDRNPPFLKVTLDFYHSISMDNR
jgi:hypothetical protein